MITSFLKILKSRFLRLALWLVFIPLFIGGSPAKSSYRLDPAVVGLVGDVHAEVCVMNDGISIEVPESYGGGGVLGLLIEAGVDSARNSDAMETLAPLKEMVKDIDFPDALHAALSTTMKGLSWPHIIDLKMRSGAPLSRKKDILMKVTEGSFLDIRSFYQLSLNAEILRISSEFALYLKGSAKAAVKGRVRFSSARIGKFEENDEAIALWAEYDGAAYRRAMKLGIEETVKMLNIALFITGGKSVLGPESKLQKMQIRTKFGEEDYRPKEQGETIMGWIVEEKENRIIFQTVEGVFMSIPRSDIISQEIKQ